MGARVTDFKRGMTVKPTAEVIACTGYREESRLVIRKDSRPRRHAERQGNRWCVGCLGKLRAAGRRRTFEEATVIAPGQLYAAGQEVGSPLCLECVEEA